jgi:hypothetical protein
LEAQEKLEDFYTGLGLPELKAGEEYEIPVNKKK